LADEHLAVYDNPAVHQLESQLFREPGAYVRFALWTPTFYSVEAIVVPQKLACSGETAASGNESVGDKVGEVGTVPYESGPSVREQLGELLRSEGCPLLLALTFLSDTNPVDKPRQRRMSVG
jgi:hypothetical protein